MLSCNVCIVMLSCNVCIAMLSCIKNQKMKIFNLGQRSCLHNKKNKHHTTEPTRINLTHARCNWIQILTYFTIKNELSSLVENAMYYYCHFTMKNVAFKAGLSTSEKLFLFTLIKVL